MNSKYYCEVCDYGINKIYNYKKHLLSNRHNKNVAKNETVSNESKTSNSENISIETNEITNISQKNVKISPKNVKFSQNGKKSGKKCNKKYEKEFKCSYCDKQYSSKYSLNRHFDKCNEYISYVNNKKQKEKERLEYQAELEKQLRKKDKKIEKLKEQTKRMDELEMEKKELNIECNNLLKQLAKSNTTTNNKTINSCYVINVFNNANNFDTELSKPLSKENIDSIIKEGTINGCSKLISINCIDNVDVDKRSIHCVDASRNKYMIRMNNEWIQDLKARKILDLSIPLTKDLFEKHYDLENMDNGYDKFYCINKLVELYSDKGKKKIIDNLNRNIVNYNSIEN